MYFQSKPAMCCFLTIKYCYVQRYKIFCVLLTAIRSVLYFLYLMLLIFYPLIKVCNIRGKLFKNNKKGMFFGSPVNWLKIT